MDLVVHKIRFEKELKKSTARTLLSLVGLAFLSTLPFTGCSDLAGDCHNTLSCPEYAEDGETGGKAPLVRVASASGMVLA